MTSEFEEIWVLLKETNSHLISNVGNIKSIKTNKIIKKHLDKDGYPRVGLYFNKKIKSFYVHRLIANNFLNNKDNKPQVNHIDGNKQNNKISNLEWVTSSENRIHAFKIGLQKNKTGEDHHNSKLTINDIKEIRKLCELNVSQYKIAKIFNIRQPQVSKIKNKKHWKDL